MRRYFYRAARLQTGDKMSKDPAARELEGLLGIGLKDDALGMARRAFKKPVISADLFNAALDVVLTCVARPKSWTKLIDSAYARLSKRGKQAAGFLMLAFHGGIPNHEVAQRFLPKRFNGPLGLAELAYAMETMLALDRMNEAEKLAHKFPHAIRQAQHPMMKAMLRNLLADYFARSGEWEKAASLWEELRLDSCFAETANLGIVELHLAAAMQAAKKGLESVEKLKSNPDPELAIMLPDNEKERWEEVQKKLNRLGKELEKVLPKQQSAESEI